MKPNSTNTTYSMRYKILLIPFFLLSLLIYILKNTQWDSKSIHKSELDGKRPCNFSNGHWAYDPDYTTPKGYYICAIDGRQV